MINLYYYTTFTPMTNGDGPNAYTGKIAYSNAQFEEAFGYQSTEIFIGPLDLPNLVFPTFDDASSWLYSQYGQALVDAINTTYGATLYMNAGLVPYKEPLMTGLAGKAALSHTHVVGDVAGLSASLTKSFANPSRSLNTAFQISTTRDALVSYTVDVQCTMSLTSGQSGTTILEYADNSGMTTNVKTVAKPTNSNSGALTIGLNLTQINGAVLSGVIPANKYVRIRTVNNTGTPTFTLQNSQETLF